MRSDLFAYGRIRGKGRTHRPGTWRWGVLGGELTIYLCCPEGHAGILTSHDVDERGVIAPSVACPYDDCDHHVWARLAGWTDEDAGRPRRRD